MLRISILLLAATLGSAQLASAQQVTKPRSPTDRLPRPAGVTALQHQDGTILLTWQAIAGAVSYKVTRSVPPAGGTTLKLPHPSDTQYVDRDVKAGSYYYYVVSAVNEANIEGMKAGASLKALTATAATSARASDPETDPGSEGSTEIPVPPPAGVVARPYPYHTPTVDWQSSVQGGPVHRRTPGSHRLCGGGPESRVADGSRSPNRQGMALLPDGGQEPAAVRVSPVSGNGD